MVTAINIGPRSVGPGQPCFIIAEAGVNHNGSLELARELVNAAVRVGADAIKFQTFETAQVATHGASKADYQLRTTDATESHYDMLRRLELSSEAHRDLMAYCKEKGTLFMSTPLGIMR